MELMDAVRLPLMFAAIAGLLVSALAVHWQRYLSKRGKPSRAVGVVALLGFLPMLASAAMELVFRSVASGRVPTPARRDHGYYAFESTAGQMSVLLYATCIVFCAVFLIWLARRFWKRGAVPPHYTRKPGIGALLARLNLAGKPLNPVQDWALELLLDVLPAQIKGVIDRQFSAIDDVRREPGGGLLIFVQSARSATHTPRLPMEGVETPLASLTALVMGEKEPLQATLTAVQGRVFSLRFNCATTGLPLSMLRLTRVAPAYPPEMLGRGQAPPAAV
jgi:hypothetical protein